MNLVPDELKELVKILSPIITAIVIALKYYLWKRKHSRKLTILCSSGADNVTLSVSNNKESESEISYIRLVRPVFGSKYRKIRKMLDITREKTTKRKKLYYYDSTFFGLVDVEGSDDDIWWVRQSQDSKHSIKIEKHGLVKEFNIPFDRIKRLYDNFILEEGQHDASAKRCDYCLSVHLERPLKMPRCAIGLFTTDGKVYEVDLPATFYDFYRNKVGSHIDNDFALLNGWSSTMKTQALRCYKESRKTQYLLST